MKQLDLICGNCPIATCDEESLWCLHRLLSNPNEAQLEATKAVKEARRQERKFRRGVRRSEYFHNYYMANREKKIQRSLDSYYAKKRESEASPPTTSNV